jgi:hypothetical protein
VEKFTQLVTQKPTISIDIAIVVVMIKKMLNHPKKPKMKTEVIQVTEETEFVKEDLPLKCQTVYLSMLDLLILGVNLLV